MDPEFGYVILVFVFMFVVYQWMAFQVVAARKKYKVDYPIQRGHQNSLESLPFFIGLLLLAGVQHPVTAAVGGIILTLGRISYFLGYATGDPKKRYNGTYQYMGLFTLLGATIASAVKLLRA